MGAPGSTRWSQLAELAALLAGAETGFVCLALPEWRLAAAGGCSLEDEEADVVLALCAEATADNVRVAPLARAGFSVQLHFASCAELPESNVRVAVGIICNASFAQEPASTRGLRTLAAQAAGLLALETELERRKATAAAQTHRLAELEGLADVVGNSPVVLIRWRLEPGWPVEFVSENVSRFGYSAGQLMSGAVSLLDLLGEDDRALTAGPSSSIPASPGYKILEYTLRTSGEAKRFVRFNVRTFTDARGRSVCEGLMREFRESLEHEERLKLFEQAVNTTHNGIVIADARLPDNPIIFVNDAAIAISGYSREEFIGRNCRFLQGGDSDQPGLEIVRAAMRERRNCDVVLQNYRKDGTPFWNEIRISPVRNKQGEVTHFIGVQADITARRDLEQVLGRRDAILEAVSFAAEELLRRENYEKGLPAALRLIGEATNADHLCVWRQKTTPAGRTLSLVHAWCGGRGKELALADFQDMPWDSKEDWPSADLLRQGRSLQGNKSGGTACERDLLERLSVDSFLCLPVFAGPDRFWGALTLGCVAGNVSWAAIEVEALLSATRVLGAVIHNLDTTLALRLSEQRFRALNEVSPVGIFEADATGRVLYANQQLKDMFDVTAGEFRSGAWRERFEKRDLAAIARAWRETVEERRGFYADFMLRQKKGYARWVKSSARPMNDAEGRLIGYVGTVDDVTDYHLATEALRESENQYRSLVTNLKEVVFKTDASGAWTYLNPAWTEVTGFECAESLGRCFLDYVHPDDRERNNQLFQPLIARQKSFCRHEVRYLTKEGGFRWIEVFAGLLLDEKDQILGTAGTLTDVTTRREAEESRRRQLAAIEAAIDGVALLDDNGVYTYLNPTHVTLFGFDKPADLIGRTWRELYAPDAVEYIEGAIFPELLRQKKWRGTMKARRRDGTFFDEELSLTLVEGGGIVCVCRDITERRKSQERIEHSLREKEVMLKEIHHRVKNNMQIVSSLLNLQLEHVRGEETRNMFIDSQNRIASMALVHEKLYQSTDLGHIDFSDYVRDLTDNLVGAQGAHGRGVCLRIESGDLYLGIDTAIPCGLIINELVSNAYKHAFPAGGPGEIALRLARSAPGWLILEVADNGRGIPPEVDLRQTRSLGMQLVFTLVQQLRGTIEIGRERGTRFFLQLQEAPQKRVIS